MRGKGLGGPRAGDAGSRVGLDVVLANEYAEGTYVTMTNRDLLQELTESYLSGVVLDTFEEADPPLDPAEHPFDAFTPFREYGIDSFLVLKILRRLENDFGSLPKTLLFENFNINDLANYFTDHHAPALGEMFAEQLQAGDATAVT